MRAPHFTMHRRPGEQRDLLDQPRTGSTVRRSKKPRTLAEGTTPDSSFGIRSEDAAATGAKLEAPFQPLMFIFG
jgi:hypothetical protein